MMPCLTAALATSLLLNGPLPDAFRKIPFEKHFAGFEGCFALRELKSKETLRHEPKRCAKRRPPCSTFKIFNALAALDCGAVTGPNDLFRWDGKARPIKSWNQDHTLATAIRDSVLWYFQEVARRIGPERMKDYIRRAGYGNEDISGGIDRFWLDSTLVISVDEQLEFLQRLYTDDLPFKTEAMDAVRRMLIFENGGDWALSGKTGTGGSHENHSLGWYVGHVRKGDRQFVFAANMTGAGASGPKTRERVRSILRELGLTDGP